jgi:hypothetical protein
VSVTVASITIITGGGRDVKCYSLPWLARLGASEPTLVTAASLPPGTSTLGIVHSGPRQGLAIDLASLQAESGPNEALKTVGAQ